MDQSLKDRLLTKFAVNSETGCWDWTGAMMGNGYGQIKLTQQRKQEYAHRAAYLVFKGLIPEGQCVLHTCDNRKCVNPDHLWLGRQHDNSQDMRRKGRHLYGERNAQAVLTINDVYAIKQILSQGLLSQAKIAVAFGVSQMEISRIHRGLRWAHVGNPDSS